MAGAGALSYNFKRKGQFLIGSEKIDEDSITEIALENDAEDIVVQEDHYEVLCEIGVFDKLNQALDQASVAPDSAELVYLPENLVEVKDKSVASQVLKLIDSLDDLEDVKAVHSNYDIDEAFIEAHSS